MSYPFQCWMRFDSLYLSVLVYCSSYRRPNLSVPFFCQIPSTDCLQLSNSGFGGIHAAISSLAARCLGNRHWSEGVKPQTDAELLDAGLPAPGKVFVTVTVLDFIEFTGFGRETRFRVSVHQKDQLLRRAIVAYLGTASDFTGISSVPRPYILCLLNDSTEPEFTLVLSPAVTTPRQEEQSSRYLGKTVTSVSSSVSYNVMDSHCTYCRRRH